MLNYTAIDFETANRRRASPCSVGLVRVRDGEAVDERHWLIRSPEECDYFEPFNVGIHGITAEMVAGQPRWLERLPDILDFIGSDPLIAHNAAFDTSVIRAACDADMVPWPELGYLCSWVMAKRALSLPSYKLPFVLHALGSSITDHHNALADAHGVVEVIRGLSERNEADDVYELAERLKVLPGTVSAHWYRSCSGWGPGLSKARADMGCASEPDPDNYLYGRVVVFTGTLGSMSRKVAQAECARIGAKAENNVTKHTNVLVIGDVNPAVLSPGSILTGKAKHAFELQAKGQDIEVMSEDEFLRCLDGQAPATVA